MGKKSNNDLRKARQQQTPHLAFTVVRKADPKPKLRVGMTVESYQERVAEWRVIS
jgi:hypothetical protein